MMLRFQHSEYLWALALLLVLQLAFISITWWKRSSIRKLGDPVLVEKLFTGYSRRRFAFRFLLVFLAFFFGVLGLANIQKGSRMEKITRKGVDVVIALDVSKSMLAGDVKPDRLTRAKQLISKLVDKLDNDRVGLVVFAGNAYLQMPLTIDYSAAKMYLSTVSPDMIPTQGTAIGQAIQVSADAFNKMERKHKAMIIISDGEDHDEAAISKANAAFDEGTVINTIGIGSPNGSPLPDAETGTYKKDKDGNTVVSKLNENELKSIAAAGKGIYEHLDNNTEEVVNSLIHKIDSMEQKEFGENIFTDYNSYFQYFLIISILLLAAEFFIPEIKRSTRANVVTATEKP